MRRPSPREPSVVTASSTPTRFRPSAPASTPRNPALLRPCSPHRPPKQPLTRPPATRPRPGKLALALMTSQATDVAAPALSARPNLCARVDGVSKLFGSFAALRQVSVDFEPGRCYVLLGENGAGKSTLLRVLAGLLRPSFGKVTVFGGLDPHAARARIGYMSHAPMLYDELTAQENLSYFAKLYPGRECLSPEEALRQVGLDPELSRLFGQ